jgi:hypothetical protein
MFIWLTTLLTGLLMPFCLVFMKWPKVVLAKAWVTEEVAERFPVSVRTPIFYAQPRQWFEKLMTKYGIRGVAFLGIVMMKEDLPVVREHEAIHVIHQSCISPIFVLLVYGFDVLAWLPFRSWWRPGYAKRISVIERVAYKIAEGDDV